MQQITYAARQLVLKAGRINELHHKENKHTRSWISFGYALVLVPILTLTHGALSLSVASERDEQKPAVAALKSELPAPALKQGVPEPKKLILTATDKKLIRLIVRMHIGGLKQQRADLFYQTFTKKTQASFSSPNEMLVFFSLRYLPVVFSAEFSFTKVTMEGEVPIQHGVLIDQRGNRWEVSYGVLNLGDGDWRIVSSAIVLVPGDPV